MPREEISTAKHNLLNVIVTIEGYDNRKTGIIRAFNRKYNGKPFILSVCLNFILLCITLCLGLIVLNNNRIDSELRNSHNATLDKSNITGNSYSKTLKSSETENEYKQNNNVFKFRNVNNATLDGPNIRGNVNNSNRKKLGSNKTENEYKQKFSNNNVFKLRDNATLDRSNITGNVNNSYSKTLKSSETENEYKQKFSNNNVFKLRNVTNATLDGPNIRGNVNYPYRKKLGSNKTENEYKQKFSNNNVFKLPTRRYKHSRINRL